MVYLQGDRPLQSHCDFWDNLHIFFTILYASFRELNHKICVPRLLVIVRVFCLLKTVSKCTHTYHFGDKNLFLCGGDQPSPQHFTLSASTALHLLTEILNMPLIGFVRPAQNETIKFVFQLVVDKVTTVHKSTTYNNKLYNIQQSIQNQTSASARCSPDIRGQLNLCSIVSAGPSDFCF